MENAVKSRLQSVQFGAIQMYKSIAIVPLIAPTDGMFQYRTLGEALATWDIAITEVSAAGSVPELMVVNRANKPVLLIDGEELAGAKQNRVLNTSILLKEVSETKIPVSCTEQGRRSYASKAFSESGNVMAYKSRSKKTRSVQCSIEASGAYHSDQGESGTASPSFRPKPAVDDGEEAYLIREGFEKLVALAEVVFPGFVNVAHGRGVMGRRPVGVDMLSLTAAYAKLHPKLVRSYMLEGLLDPKAKPTTHQTPSPPAPKHS